MGNVNENRAIIDSIMDHDVKDIIRAMLPFMNWPSGQSALQSILNQLEPKWYHSIDVYTIALPLVDKLTTFCDRITQTDNSNWGCGEDYQVSRYTCNLCGASIVGEDDRAHHFRSCTVMKTILDASDGIPLLHHHLERYMK